MQMRRLGRTGLQVTAIGCGGIPIFRAEKPEAVKVLRYAIDKGINYFDTARGYDNGGSEERLAEAIKGQRHKVIIASKATVRTRDEMAKAVDDSLKALQVDMIDVYKCHHVITPEEWAAGERPRRGPGGAAGSQAEGQDTLHRHQRAPPRGARRGGEVRRDRRAAHPLQLREGRGGRGSCSRSPGPTTWASPS